MEDRVKMAEMWVANPRSSNHLTSGAGGGMILNDDVWELRIHFDSQPNIDMKLCSSHVTFLNMYAVLQTQGASATTKEDKLAAIVYDPPVLYDLSEPAVLDVDPEGVVFHSSPSQPTAFCTQESINFRKDNLNVIMEEEPVFEQSHNSSDAYDSDNNSDNSSQLAEEEEDVDQSEDSDENSDEELLHYEDEEDDWLLFEDDDDGHEPPSFVLPKGRKSRAKKRKPRIWYNNKLEHPHQQLFIKGEKTFAIKKMRLEHTCPTNTEKSRISAKWLAKTYESLFRFDPSTSINTLMDNCRENYGVDAGRHMAYRAKNLVVEAVLREHKRRYPRLRDYAQTIMDTNPGNRVVVTTVTSKPTTKIPHPTPRLELEHHSLQLQDHNLSCKTKEGSKITASPCKIYQKINN
ncbi:hypothetical protein D1007_13624 [Hordeum vulgare]|nr:hypothetical protein D1007_13624 [Hordeum vulgare]